MSTISLPRILVIDDVLGRRLPDAPNEQRSSMCAQYLLRDVTDDGPAASQIVKEPIAEAVFCRGQTPISAGVGAVIENSLESVLEAIDRGWDHRSEGVPRWALVLLDLCFLTGAVTASSDAEQPGMPDGQPGDRRPEGYFGLRILKAIERDFPSLPTIILSSMPSDRISHEYAYLGGLDFIIREDPKGPSQLEDDIAYHGLLRDDSGEILGDSTALLTALRTARRASSNRNHILMRGERGTGKELLAGYLNRYGGKDSRRPLIVVDSGTMTPSLYLSELFGHRRGSFTDAKENRIGRIVEADGGDLFLDEIGNMPEAVQTGLLRVIDTGVLTPIGTSEESRVDIRVLSATNEDIERKAINGRFRSDLLDRLRTGGTIVLPPLRDRREDIPALAVKYVREAENGHPDARMREIDSEAMEMLCAHSWPGNIRALRDCMTAAVVNFPHNEHLVPLHLNLFGDGHGLLGPHAADASKRFAAMGVKDDCDLDVLIAAMSSFSFEHSDSGDLVGQLPALRRSYARLAASLLRAALRATSRTTPANPEGEFLIHPALKLITRDSALRASKAADMVKQILKIDAAVASEALEDPVLRSALETALKLRPVKQRAPKKKPGAV